MTSPSTMPTDDRGETVARGAPSLRRPRGVEVAFLVMANLCLLLAGAYIFLERGDLPGFFPHARSAGTSDDANDIAMGIVLLGCAAGFYYCRSYARKHRSWLRSSRWHRKHGRI